MGRKSTINTLDPSIKDAVDQAIASGRATLADIVSMIKQMGGQASMSSVHRYRSQVEDRLERYRETQNIAKVWIGEIGKEPDGDIGRLVTEILRMLAYKSTDSFTGEREEAKDIAYLAKALKDLSGADAATVAMRLAVRKEFAAKAAAEAAKAVKSQGLSDDAAAEIQRRILGLAE